MTTPHSEPGVSGPRLTSNGLSLKGKLILLFVLIKVLPLLLLAFLARDQIRQLGHELSSSFEQQGLQSVRALNSAADAAIEDSVMALDTAARDNIERMSTDTARAIAAFLYARDADLRLVAQLPASADSYRQFILSRQAALPIAPEWQLSADGSQWQILGDTGNHHETPAELLDNPTVVELHYRAPEAINQTRMLPLYRELTLISLDGQEQLKILGDGTVSQELHNVQQRQYSFAGSEHYFSELAGLNAGEIYVSEVIGEYRPAHLIGLYTPATAARAGLNYHPEEEAYAGPENPHGKRFEGIVRWVMPIDHNGQRQGYISLALDHQHLQAFTDYLRPTNERYSNTGDARDGNYAFIWDDLGRNIAHPRHYFITGFNRKTGEREVPWLPEEDWAAYLNSGLPFSEFSQQLANYEDQGNHRKASKAQAAQGLVGLDCRYLDFAPQCKGWMDLTQDGGSGSFLLNWSGISKLTTVAPIPYFTGRYGNSPRGFGFVSIGANVDDFHRSANDTRERISHQIDHFSTNLEATSRKVSERVSDTMTTTTSRLGVVTAVMTMLVVLIAIWIAVYLSSHIRALINGISRFQQGERNFRFATRKRDEIAQLATAFNGMADSIQSNIQSLETEIRQRQQTEILLRKMQDQLEHLVDERTAALTAANAELHFQIEERRQAESRARHMAEHDPLTGLANRLKFQAQVEIALINNHDHQQRLVLMFLDLDRFKSVNDTLGHHMGDQLLCQVARTISRQVRMADTVARLGGDEFAILMTNIAEDHTVERIASQIIESLNEPFLIEGNAILTGTSVGISRFPDDARDADLLLIQADQAMYAAKNDGGNRFCWYHKIPLHQA